MTKVIPFQPELTFRQFKATQVQLTYRSRVPLKERVRVTHSGTAYELLRRSWNENKIELVEQFKILLLDQQNNCLGISEIGTGGLAGCMADPRLIFATALKAKASSMILAHNHPSGNLTPSDTDLQLTRKLRDGGRLLDIAVLDHLILTPESYRSLSDEGLMPG